MIQSIPSLTDLLAPLERLLLGERQRQDFTNNWLYAS